MVITNVKSKEFNQVVSWVPVFSFKNEFQIWPCNSSEQDIPGCGKLALIYAHSRRGREEGEGGIKLYKRKRGIAQERQPAEQQ